MGLRLSPTIATQNTRLISCLGITIGKGFNTYFWSSPITRPKKEYFFCKWISRRENTQI
jgi:hypothetical protein